MFRPLGIWIRRLYDLAARLDHLGHLAFAQDLHHPGHLGHLASHFDPSRAVLKVKKTN